MRTVSIRPDAIWGIGSIIISKLNEWGGGPVYELVNNAKTGQLKFIGTVNPLKSTSNVSNVVDVLIRVYFSDKRSNIFRQLKKVKEENFIM